MEKPMTPRARMLTAEEVERIREWCKKQSLLVICQENFIEMKAQEVKDIMDTLTAALKVVEAAKTFKSVDRHCCEDCPCGYWEEQISEALKPFQGGD